MKNRLCLLAVAVMLLSGCTKKYDNIEDYYADMSLKSQKMLK